MLLRCWSFTISNFASSLSIPPALSGLKSLGISREREWPISVAASQARRRAHQHARRQEHADVPDARAQEAVAMRARADVQRGIERAHAEVLQCKGVELGAGAEEEARGKL